MKDLISKQTMTSREIAELSGKQHKDVIRSIRNMEGAWGKINGRNFTLVEYIDEKGEKSPMYQLSKTECLYIATKKSRKTFAVMKKRILILKTI